MTLSEILKSHKLQWPLRASFATQDKCGRVIFWGGSQEGVTLKGDRWIFDIELGARPYNRVTGIDTAEDWNTAKVGRDEA